MNRHHLVTMLVLAIWALAKMSYLYKSPVERKAIAGHRKWRDDHNEKINQHYKCMNEHYGCSFEKIDEGWWTEDRTFLSKYAGLVARWKPGGDLFTD
jgi:hypothetical protein